MVAPVVGAALISGASSLLGGILGGGGAKKAAEIQQQTAREQIAATERNRDYQYNLNAPTIERGENAGNLFSGFLGAGGGTDYGAYVRSNPDLLQYYTSHNGRDLFTGGDSMSLADYGRQHYNTYGQGEGRDVSAFTSSDGGSSAALDAFRGSTGYKDLVREGLGAVNANAYASGLGRSGAAYKALQDRGTSLADRSAGEWLGNLGTLMNLGGQARGLVANIGTNSVNATNAASQNAADASSNASLAAGANWSSVLQNLGTAASAAYGSSYGGNNSGGGYNFLPADPWAGLPNSKNGWALN